MRTRLEARIAAPQVLHQLHVALTPSVEARGTIWGRILRSLQGVHAHTLLQRCREWLSAFRDEQVMLWQRLQPRLAEARQSPPFTRALKWVAAFLLIIFVVQVSPRLFWAPKTSAESVTTLLPTGGQVYVFVGDLWQPVLEEVTVKGGMRVKTGNGQATVVLGDDGVIRLDAHTEVGLMDISDRLEPATELVPTVALISGRVWMQGLVPAHLRGLTVSTSVGLVTVHEGSVSIEGDKNVTIAVYDRRASVTHDGRDVLLVSGERTQLWDGNVMVVKKVPDDWLDMPWATNNLGRDAVHRQEIAALQQARLAERAGILPTSSLYSVKRAVEAVDVFLTLSQEARMQKKLQYADARLTEAAALLAEGQTGAVALPLEEYRSTLLALATGSGDSTLAHFLLRQAVIENTGEISAVLPGDQGYILKKVVLETSSALSPDVAQVGDVQEGMLLDALAVLTQAVDSGNVQGVQEMWADLEPQLKILHDTGATLSPGTRKEATAALGALALSMREQEESGRAESLDPLVREEIAAYLPVEEEALPVLSEDDVQSIVMGIKKRIFTYHLQQSRINQFTAEMRAMEGHPDEGRILRRLYFALPDGPESFPERVRQEIVKLSWRNASVAAK